MIVTYWKQDERVISIIMGFSTVWEENNQLLIEDGICPLLNDLTKSGWGIYKDKDIQRDDDKGNSIIWHLGELELEHITIDDLPVSEHIGKLIAVNPSLAKPATVRRRFMGENYDVSCLVTQSVAELFQQGDIQIGDYVLVSFIEETPNGTERNVAIVTDKVYKSWG